MKVKRTNLPTRTSEYCLRYRSEEPAEESDDIQMQVETSSEAASAPSSASISPNDPISTLTGVPVQAHDEKDIGDEDEENDLNEAGVSNGEVGEGQEAIGVEDELEELEEEDAEEDEEEEDEEEDEGIDTPPPTMAAWHPAVDHPTAANVALPSLGEDKPSPQPSEAQNQQAQIITLNPVTWQLFQQERTRVNSNMDDSMFVHWLLTNIRPSAYFQHMRSPANPAGPAAVAMAHPTPASGVETGVQPASTPSTDGGNAASMMHLAAAAAAAASCGGVSGSPYPSNGPIPSVANAAVMRGLYCTICRKHFSSRAGLIQHQRGMHAYQPHFRCNKCGQRFRWASQLHDHRRKGYCPGPLTSPSSQMPGGMNRLPVMGGGSDNVLRLPPISSVASNGTLPCNGGEHGDDEGLPLDDAEVSAMAQDMEELIEALADDALPSQGNISCPECSFTTSTRENLELHFKTAHVVEDLFSCTCGSDFACLSLFLCHYISCPIAATDLGQKAATAAATQNATSAAQETTPTTATPTSNPPLPPPQPPQPPPQVQAQPQPQYPLPPPLGHHRMPPPPHFFPLRPPPLGAADHQFPGTQAVPGAMPQVLPNSAVAAGRPRAPNGQANCQYCNQTFSNKNTLKQHIIGMHSHEAQYHCEHCGKPFRWAPSYYTHRRKCGLAARGLGPSPRGRGRGATNMARYC